MDNPLIKRSSWRPIKPESLKILVVTVRGHFNQTGLLDGLLEPYTGGQKLQTFFFLRPSDNYAPLCNSKNNKYTWPLYKKMWASTGKLPHHSIASINQHISNCEALWA